MTVQNQPHGPTAEQAYHHQRAFEGMVPNLYQQLPLDVVRRISALVATGDTPIEAAENAIRAGRVDLCFHALSHELPVAGVIELGAQSPRGWINGTPEEHDQVWPRSVRYLVDHTGRVLQRYVTGGGHL